MFNNFPQQQYIQMNKQVTFGHILTFLGIIVIPLIIWGNSIETRFERVIVNSNEIEDLKIESKNADVTIQNNHIEIMQQLHNIELQLKDKKDRE